MADADWPAVTAGMAGCRMRCLGGGGLHGVLTKGVQGVQYSGFSSARGRRSRYSGLSSVRARVKVPLGEDQGDMGLESLLLGSEIM